jgi:hypothetical protein
MSGTEGQIMSEVTLSKKEQLDTLMRELHGSAFDEFVQEAMSFAYDRGLLEGHRLGTNEAWRKAKGLKGRPKRRGKPSWIDDRVATLMVHEVGEAQKSGIAPKDAVIDFLVRQELGNKVLNDRSLDEAMTDFLDAQDLGKKVDDRKILASVSAIKRTLEAVQKELDDPSRRLTAMKFYHRIRSKGRSRSSLQHSTDEALRNRIDFLKKQRMRVDT